MKKLINTILLDEICTPLCDLIIISRCKDNYFQNTKHTFSFFYLVASTVEPPYYDGPTKKTGINIIADTRSSLIINHPSLFHKPLRHRAHLGRHAHEVHAVGEARDVEGGGF